MEKHLHEQNLKLYRTGAITNDADWAQMPLCVISMPKSSSRLICPKCGKPMHFVIVKTGGQKFRCIKCDDVDPMQVPDFQAWAKSELRPPTT